MGVSTDAILCWGIDFGEEIPWDEKAAELGYESGDEDEFLAEVLCGLKPPKTKYESDKETHQAYWKAKREALKEYGIELIRHCSYDYPMYILAIAASENRARRGYPSIVTSLEVPVEWQTLLSDACEKLGVASDEKREWILCSMWG